MTSASGPPPREGVHPAAAVGFDRAAGAYAASRPSYPRAVVERLASEGLTPESRVVDLAAGTGILTLQLVAAGFDVVAVEPVASMRDELRRSLPDVEVLDALAEDLPFGDATVDAVTVAQGFHWFDAPRALAEIARALRPDGLLLLVWNVRDESVPWMRRWTDLVHDVAGGRPYSDHREQPWTEVVARSGLFTPLRSERLDNPFPTSRELVLERTRSTSYVAALDPGPREELLASIGRLVDTDPDTAGRDTFTFPNLTDLHWCHRLP